MIDTFSRRKSLKRKNEKEKNLVKSSEKTHKYIEVT